MDKLERFKKTIKDVLKPYSRIKYKVGQYENETVFDDETGRYLIISQGLDYLGIRHHSCLLHLEIVNGKIWIQKDNTEDGIADDLINAGIEKSEIVLGFHEPKVRRYTEFAVA